MSVNPSLDEGTPLPSFDENVLALTVLAVGAVVGMRQGSHARAAVQHGVTALGRRQLGDDVEGARERAHDLELVMSRFVGSGCVTADHGALIEDTKGFHTFRDYSFFLSGSFFVVGVVQLQDVVNLAEKRSRRVQRSLMVDLDAVRRLVIDMIPHISIGSHVVNS